MYLYVCIRVMYDVYIHAYIYIYILPLLSLHANMLPEAEKGLGSSNVLAPRFFFHEELVCGSFILVEAVAIAIAIATYRDIPFDSDGKSRFSL